MTRMFHRVTERLRVVRVVRRRRHDDRASRRAFKRPEIDPTRLNSPFARKIFLGRNIVVRARVDRDRVRVERVVVVRRVRKERVD